MQTEPPRKTNRLALISIFLSVLGVLPSAFLLANLGDYRYHQVDAGDRLIRFALVATLAGLLVGVGAMAAKTQQRIARLGIVLAILAMLAAVCGSFFLHFDIA